MLDKYTMKIKTKIVFGAGVVSDIASEIACFGVRKIMLVADGGVRKTGLVEKVSGLLQEASYAVLDFDEIVENPQSFDCERGAQLALDNKIELIVAVGGGSSMDTAKAIAGMAGHGTTCFQDIMYPKEYTCKPLPLICIPTTAGTGSEVTTCGVITDSATHKKVYCFDPECAPDVAIADPEMLMTLPGPIAAMTGVDALTHAIEAYVATCTNDITAAYGIYAIRIIADNIREYVNHRNIQNASAMMIGSLMAGIAFGYSDTCCVHTLSETISKYYRIPHGMGNAIFLAPVTRFSISGDYQRYADVAETMRLAKHGGTPQENAELLVEALEKLVDDLEIPKLSDIEEVNPVDFENIAHDCMDHISIPSNPRRMEESDFVQILQETYDAE
ncbi:iron-containing alcohol dehydrogenase [Jutongia sp.]